MRVLSSETKVPLAREELNTRSRAFKFSLTKNITAEMGDTLHPEFRTRLVADLVEAHARTHHAIDVRTTVPWFGGRRYLVAQAGAAPMAQLVRDGGPLAARVLEALPDGALDGLTERERSIIANCVERSEITQTHPFDWRPRLTLRIWRLYFNLIAGPDRRDSSISVNRDRRAPSSEYLGVIVISVLAAALAAAGIWLISDALLKAFFDPDVIKTLSDLLAV